MIKSNLNKMVKNNIYLILLITIIALTILSTSYLSILKKNQEESLLNILENTFLKKTTLHLVNKLNPRFTHVNFKVSKGDTFEKILNRIKIDKSEKRIVIKNLSKFKKINSLNNGQIISFKLDNANSIVKVLEVSIEQSKTKKYVYYRINNLNKFNYKEIDKDLKKNSSLQRI